VDDDAAFGLIVAVKFLFSLFALFEDPFP